LIPTYPLPLLMPLESIPVIGFPLADTLDPPLRVIVESAYDRSAGSTGVPTPFNPLYFPNPATFGTNLLVAIPTGLDNGISDFGVGRPLGTIRPGPYGVGGQPTPQLSTPSKGTSPTIPVLFSSPGGGLLTLLVPANLLGSLTAFNGGLPSLPSSLNPLDGPPNPGTAAVQAPTGAPQVVPAVGSSTTDTPAWPPPTTLNQAQQQQLGPQVGVTEATDPSMTNAAPQPSNVQSNNTNVRPRVDVSRNSFGAPVAQQGTSSTNGPQSKINPIGSAAAGAMKSITGVTKSIGSALGGLASAASGGTK
jgi:hypothetical protein